MKAGEKQGDVFPLFNSNGKQISTSVLETERGFYFGFFAQP